MSRLLRILTVAGALALTASACGAPPADQGKSESGAKGFKACMVSDSGGFDDKSFNQTSYKGLTDAVAALGIAKAQLESKSDNDYPTNINTMVRQKCDIIVTIGFKYGDVTYAAAKANPETKFAIVDYSYDPVKNPPLPNLQGLVFNSAQPSFLAGYLAAATTKSGKVGTFGGINIPTVAIFMDGFAEGIQYYNQHKNKQVQLLGWDEATQQGVITNDFQDKNTAKTKANDLISQGADILLPVAGPAGLGALEAARSAGGKVTAIWVDTDGCVSAAEYCASLLTSVQKSMDVAVQKAVSDAYAKQFSTATYVGTLANKGVGLAPYHEFDATIPAELKNEITALAADIASGKVALVSKAQPTAG
ncbi:BMP family ABC transporter substrate-binding protein [Nocardia panacis]|uniref:BMP family ABC transporter substrate-binding protein n=1 Tax=Nocardia panacis TaxID=2340916 RepID=A0A3A4KGP9_9NOCA|nr:BMP family ABC transporter substrate-binding protein [Nocardia panacis]RJO75168.1 BMP family ABC transporter substrate-binding protein [Nocardia panacis]